MNRSLSALTNAELRSLELDPATPGDVLTAVSAEMMRRNMDIARPVEASHSSAQRVAIVGLDMPFVNLVLLLAKVAVAAIPAILIIAVAARLAGAVGGAVVSAVVH